MRIQFIADRLPYIPARDGFRMYSGNLLRALSRRHEIDVVAIATEADIERLHLVRPYSRSITPVRLASRGLPRRIAGLLSAYARGRNGHIARRLHEATGSPHSSHWDIVHIEGSLVAGALPRDLGPAILSVHDAETLRCQEMALCSPDLRTKLYYRLLKLHESRYQRLVYRRYRRRGHPERRRYRLLPAGRGAEAGR